MKSKFQNLKIQVWEHAGKLGGSRPSLCIQAAADSGKVLLDVMNELKAAGPTANRILTTLPNIRKNALTTIRISLAPETEELKQMSLIRNGTIATFEFTPQGLEEFRRAVIAWLDGAEDFSLHPVGSRKARDLKRRHELGRKDLASGELWFWTPGMEP